MSAMSSQLENLDEDELISLQNKLKALQKKKQEEKNQTLYGGKTLEIFLKEIQQSKGGLVKDFVYVEDWFNDINEPGIEIKEEKKDDRNERDKKLKKYNYIIDHKVRIDYRSNNKIVVKGNIQSGKTEYMIALMFYMILICKVSVSIIVRNYTQDRVQLIKRINEFKKKYGKIYKQLYDVGVVEDILKLYGNNIPESHNSSPKIYILLNNHKNVSFMNKLSIVFNFDYCVIFDEADLIDSAADDDDIDQCEKAKDIELLKKRSLQTVWVSGTVIDKLVKEEGITSDDIIILKDPKNYKSIMNGHIKMISVDGTYIGTSSKNVFEVNPNIEEFLDNYSKRSILQSRVSDILDSQPNICLFTVTNIQEVMINFQNNIEDKFPEKFVSIVYNGEGTIVRKKNSITHKKIGISECLQLLKNSGEEYNHIIIISGLMASRGISFVSDDYGWHLTDQYSLISKDMNEADLLQKIRLHGIYNDDIKLTLYTNAVDDIQKAMLKPEEMISRFKEQTEISDSKTFLKNMPINEDKFSKRSVTRTAIIKPNKIKGDDGGFSLDTYERKDTIPESVLNIYGIELSEEQVNTNIRRRVIDTLDVDEDNEEEENKEDLARMIASINTSILNGNKKSTKIATFYSLISPSIEYTKKEILDRLKDAGYNQPSSIFSSITKPSNIFTSKKRADYGGFVLYIVADKGITQSKKYKIREEIKVCWNN